MILYQLTISYMIRLFDASVILAIIRTNSSIKYPQFRFLFDFGFLLSKYNISSIAITIRL